MSGGARRSAGAHQRGGRPARPDGPAAAGVPVGGRPAWLTAEAHVGD